MNGPPDSTGQPREQQFFRGLMDGVRELATEMDAAGCRQLVVQPSKGCTDRH